MSADQARAAAEARKAAAARRMATERKAAAGAAAQQPQTLDDRVSGALKKVTDYTGGLQNSLMEGLTGGVVGDEARAAVGAFTSPKTYDQALTDERAADQAFQENHPVASTGARIAGAVAGPGRLAMPFGGVKGAAVAGGLTSAAEGFMEGEGGLDPRLRKAGTDGTIGLFAGGLLAGLGKGAHRAVQATFSKAEARPTVQNLQSAKNAAYALVRRSGHKFSGDDMATLSRRMERLSKTADWDVDPEFNKGAMEALGVFERRSGKPITLNNLDKLRQRLWNVYKRTDEPFVLQGISEIDNLIAKGADGNDLIKAARLANSRYMKADLLENAFRKAELQTAATGSGGNLVNKYRQAVTRIVTTPREAKWFSQGELDVMEQFIRGSNTENNLRLAGKLAPNGNGLMAALNLYAATINPVMLAGSAMGGVAHGAAEMAAKRGSGDILDAVATGVIKSPPRAIPLQPIGVGGAAAVNDLRR